MTFNIGTLISSNPGTVVNLPAAGYTQSNGTLRLNGGSFSTPGTITLAGGVIEGGAPGTLTADINQTGGAIRPGLSPGLLNITGNFTQAAGADINFEIFGTGGPGAANGHDQINITGDATVDGDFIVTVDPGYVPILGDTFTIAMASGTTMGNNTLSLPDISSFGFEFSDANSTPNALILEVVALSGCGITSAQSGDWADTNTWTGGVVPTGADDVCVDGADAVTVSTAGQAANLLTHTSSAPFSITGGSLTLGSASSIGTAGLNQTGGTLDGADLTVGGPTTWSGGTISGASAFNPDGGLTISGSVSLQDGRTLNNNGTTVLMATGTLTTGGGVGATINNTASFDIQSAGSFLGGFGGTNVFNNAGT
ncbi:MAG: hypothetical protein ACRD5F_11335, partial [Candidatus Acidiferrales bacterium]